MEKFRSLRADEVEVRVARAMEKGVQLLLYKDARCDMNILDETVGPENWQRAHSRDNANCTVSIWDEKKAQWISKEDTGTESNTEAQKGLASDSFKRACFNWGIGRELYTAPFIWFSAADCEKLQKNERRNAWECKDNFRVTELESEDNTIIRLVVTNGKKSFEYGQPIKCDSCGAVIRPVMKNGLHSALEVKAARHGLCAACAKKQKEGEQE